MFYCLVLAISIVNAIPLLILFIQHKNIIDFYKQNVQLVTNPILAFTIYLILYYLFNFNDFNDSLSSEQIWLIAASAATGTCIIDVIQAVSKLLKK